MTISKGQEWGKQIERPPNLRVAASDAEFAQLADLGGQTPLTITGGDLFQSLGSPPARDPVRRLPLDLIEVSIDGKRCQAVSNAIVHRPWWTGSYWAGELIVISNVGVISGRSVAPRAHPNDGRIDVIEIDSSFGLRQRLQAFRRLPTGTHLPHPSIGYRQVTSAEWEFEQPLCVRVDGVGWGRARRLAVRVVPDATQVVV